MHAWPMGAKPPFPFMVWFASAWVSDLSDIAMILVAAPAYGSICGFKRMRTSTLNSFLIRILLLFECQQLVDSLREVRKHQLMPPSDIYTPRPSCPLCWNSYPKQTLNVLSLSTKHDGQAMQLMICNFYFYFWPNFLFVNHMNDVLLRQWLSFNAICVQLFFFFWGNRSDFVLRGIKTWQV